MSLPAPNLDDRTFQSLVDDAKRMVQQRCPEWTDHNVSDPGVTLIETVAYMVDQVIYRLNRVPERTYIKFLELLGLRLAPPSAARAAITFWLSAAQDQVIAVPPATQVATPRTEEEPVTFSTVEDLDIVPCSLHRVATGIDGTQVDHTDILANDQAFYCFDRVPKPGDSLYVGLSNAVPSCAVTLRFGCDIEGVGVDPRYPPIVWEAWDGDRWVECEVDRDETGGLNRAGDVVLHVPRSHRSHAGIVKQAAGWLRCRVVENAEWQPAYSASPRITRLSAFTIGGTTDAVNAEIIRNEIVGISEGVPAQRFRLENRPVVPGDHPYTLEVSNLDGWEEWTQVPSFAMSGPDDPHFLIEETSGEVVFGPAVREADGGLVQYGKVPQKGLPIRIREYRTGGGRQGNVARSTVSVLKTTIPFIGSVVNRAAAVGGTDGEDIDNAKLRGPILLQTRHRAVTGADYEHLAVAAAKEIARARCAPAGSDGVDAGGVHVLLVPSVEDGEHGSLEFHQMVPPDDVYARVSDYLEERRTVGARVLVRPPGYVGISVVARLRARPRAVPQELEDAALAAIYTWYHPLRGGPDGTGWPFGRPVVAGELYGVLQPLPDVEFVEEVRLYPGDPIERRRFERTDRIELGPHDLVFSWGHQVMVRAT